MSMPAPLRHFSATFPMVFVKSNIINGKLILFQCISGRITMISKGVIISGMRIVNEYDSFRSTAR